MSCEYVCVCVSVYTSKGEARPTVLLGQGLPLNLKLKVSTELTSKQASGHSVPLPSQS